MADIYMVKKKRKKKPIDFNQTINVFIAWSEGKLL